MSRTCPYCKEGKATFSRWWWLDVDTYLTCSHCRARLAHVNFLATAILYAIALMLLYWVFQHWGLHHSIVSAKRMTIFIAVVFFAVIGGIRLGLVWLLWWLKTPIAPNFFDKGEQPEHKDDEPWWRPFVEDERQDFSQNNNN